MKENCIIFPDYQVGCLCDKYQNSYSKNKSALILLWLSIIITVIMIYQFIYNDIIGLYVTEERLYNTCGFVSDIYNDIFVGLSLSG